MFESTLSTRPLSHKFVVFLAVGNGEYLSEFATVCRNTQWCESVAQGKLFDKKKLELENIARLSLYGGLHGFITSIFLETFNNYYLKGVSHEIFYFILYF